MSSRAVALSLMLATQTLLPAASPGVARISWAPDGQRMTYCLGSGFHVADADGRSLRGMGAGTGAQWCPDGTTILYVGPDGVSVVDPERTQVRVLAKGREAVWSPDGSQIAYMAGPDVADRYNLHTISPDGSNPRLVLSDPYGSTFAWYGLSWVPDGSQLAFVLLKGPWSMTHPNPPPTAQAVNLLTGAVTGLAEPFIGAVTWSPDGRHVAYSWPVDGRDQLFMMDASGLNSHRLAVSLANDRAPAWSPDGAWIAFDSDRSNYGDVYAVRTDGTGLVQLTRGSAWEHDACWSPAGDRIAFVNQSDSWVSTVPWVAPVTAVRAVSWGQMKAGPGDAARR